MEIIIAIIVAIFVLAKIGMMKDKGFGKSLESKGYKYFFNGYGKDYIAFDVDNKLIKIGNMKTKFEKDISISDIIDHRWKWVENSKALRTKNKFSITLRDPDYPLHEIDYGISGGWAEKEWAKFQSVLSNY